MGFCGLKYCDIIKELQRRHMNDIAVKILGCLDVTTVQSVKVVSKDWCKAVADGNDKIWKSVLNNAWDSDPSTVWQKMRRHLTEDFPVPTSDSQYNWRLCNTTQLAYDETLKKWGTDFTVDYLPYHRDPNLRFDCWYHFEMNEYFLVAWDSSVDKIKYLSRRTLKPLLLDEDYSQREISVGPGHNFCLVNKGMYFGALLVPDGVDLQPGDENNKAEHLCLIDLPRKLVTNEAFKGIKKGKGEIFFDTASVGMVGYSTQYIHIEDCFIMMVFYKKHSDLRLIVWKLVGNSLVGKVEARNGGQISTNYWKTVTVPFTIKDYFFMDANYLVVLGRERCSGSTFLVYSMKKQEIGKPKLINSFHVQGAEQVQYKVGFLVTATKSGVISFFDVKSGLVHRLIKTPIDFSAPGSLMRLGCYSATFVICSASTRGTHFQFWNFEEAVDLRFPSDRPMFSFDAFTGPIVDFKFDLLGIVAVLESDCECGIQVLQHLNSCGKCKLIFSTDRLKRCSRCRLAKYCSKSCQRSHWGHHKTICTKLVGIRQN